VVRFDSAAQTDFAGKPLTRCEQETVIGFLSDIAVLVLKGE